MFDTQITARDRVMSTMFLILLLCWSCFGSAQGQLDKSRYITVDEVQKDMEGYCLTVFEGNKVEKFGLKVLSVVKDWEPKRDAILVIGTDPRFVHAGTVHGCSGSPVYIDGRLAGALAAGWDGSKDPLYFVTPIKYMLEVGTAGPGVKKVSDPFNFSGGVIDLAGWRKSYLAALKKQSEAVRGNFSAGRKLLPLATSFPVDVCDLLSDQLSIGGFSAVPTGAAGSGTKTADAESKFEPGGVLTIPLVWGDITMSASGTITEVEGNKVYAFGHNLFGTGAVDLPMATGTVHTVVPGLLNAFKYTTTNEPAGALRFDESAGIVGMIGTEAKSIPLVMKVKRYNDADEQVYNYRIGVEKLRSPLMIQSAIIAAASMKGSLPPEHAIHYKSAIGIEGFEPIRFSNISSGQDVMELGSEVVSIVGQLMNNRYEEANITSVGIEMDIQAVDKRTIIKSIELSDSTVRAGEDVEVSVVLQGYMSEKSLEKFTVSVPGDLKAGQYEVLVAGAGEYEKYLRKVAVHKFMAHDLASMVQAFRNIVVIRRDRLYVTMTLGAGGVTIRQKEMPYLPGTKAMLMQDATRTTQMRPMQHWLEEDRFTGKITVGEQTMRINVVE